MDTFTESAPAECAPVVPGREPASLNPYQRVVAKMATQHRLLSVHWELTYRCNESCTHCYLDVLAPGDQVAGELSTEQALGAIENALLDLKAKTGQDLQYYQAWWVAQIANQGITSNNLQEAKAAAQIAGLILQDATKAR